MGIVLASIAIGVMSGGCGMRHDDEGYQTNRFPLQTFTVTGVVGRSRAHLQFLRYDPPRLRHYILTMPSGGALWLPASAPSALHDYLNQRVELIVEGQTGHFGASGTYYHVTKVVGIQTNAPLDQIKFGN